ncbi:MAG: hypothetical protein WKF77_04195 [Planctomycetaceae bacterium]
MAAQLLVSGNGLGRHTTTIYNTICQVDVRANRQRFTYDSTGARTLLIDPLNRRTMSAYDAAGQQDLRIDARSNHTTCSYDKQNQLCTNGGTRRGPNPTDRMPLTVQNWVLNMLQNDIKQHSM